MQKKNIALLVVGSLSIAVATVALLLQRTERAQQKQTVADRRDELDTILEAFDGVWDLNDSSPMTPGMRFKDVQKAADKLRAMGANVLPRLMEEVRTVGRVEQTNRTAATVATRRLAYAFKMLGSDARPLLPELIEEFRTGRNIGASVAAMSYIGGTDAGLTIVAGLTNSDTYIRNTAEYVIGNFGTNREVALAATPPMLLQLKDSSAFSRAQSSTILGSLRVNPETVIPALLQIAEHDPDALARACAIKAIGCYGTNAVSVESRLENIMTSDKEPHVRQTAEIALQAVQGKIEPDHQSVRSSR